MNTYAPTGNVYSPGAAYEVPGFDPEWSTSVKHQPQDADDTDFQDLELPVNKGETLPFACMLFIEGDFEETVQIQVQTPDDSLGGFMVQGILDTGAYATKSYSADVFNADTEDEWAAGVEGSLTSFHALRVEGMVIAKTTGMLKVRVSGTTTVQAGSFLKGYRMHDARNV
jgi:hypothetical protein